MCRLFVMLFFLSARYRLFLRATEIFLRLSRKPYLLGVVLYLIHNDKQQRHHQKIRNGAEQAGLTSDISCMPIYAIKINLFVRVLRRAK